MKERTGILPRTNRRRFLQGIAAGTASLGAFACSSASHATRATPDRLAGLDKYVENAMARWWAPSWYDDADDLGEFVRR